MSTAGVAIPLSVPTKAAQMFPTLTPAQIARIQAHGRIRRVEEGEVLVEPGQATHLFVVAEGELQIVRAEKGSETLVAVVGPGMFTGEVNLLSGRRGFVQIRVSKSG